MKKKFFAAAMAACLFCSVFNVGVFAENAGVTVWNTLGGSSGRVTCMMEANVTHQTAQQTGTEGNYYETITYIFNLQLLMDSWKLTGTFNTGYSSTQKSASANKANSCSVSAFKAGNDEFISGQFKATSKSTAFGNSSKEFNVTY